MVLKMMALPPARFAPASASRASWSMCMLHGVTMLQVEAMPMIGFLKSSCFEADGVKHGAAGRAFGPSSTMLEYRRAPRCFCRWIWNRFVSLKADLNAKRSRWQAVNGRPKSAPDVRVTPRCFARNHR